MLKKIKQSLIEFKNNFKNAVILNKNSFKLITEKPLTFSLKYFFVFIFILNFVFLFLFILKVNFFNGYKTIKILKKSVNNLPKNLVVTIKNNHLSTNHSMPVFIWFESIGNKRLLMVLDETAQEKNIKDYGSYILLTSKSAVFNNDFSSQNYKTMPYKIDYVKVTKKNMIDFINSISKIVPFLIILFFLIIILLVPIGIFIGYLFYMVFVSFLAYIIFKLYSSKHNFIKTLKLSLHSSTIPIIINYLILNTRAKIGFINSGQIFFILIFIFLFISLNNVFPLKKKSVKS